MFILNQEKNRIRKIKENESFAILGDNIYIENGSGGIFLLGEYESFEGCQEVMVNILHSIEVGKKTFKMPSKVDIHYFSKTMKGEN